MAGPFATKLYFHKSNVIKWYIMRVFANCSFGQFGQSKYARMGDVCHFPSILMSTAYK
jgi:hypothetical protein